MGLPHSSSVIRKMYNGRRLPRRISFFFPPKRERMIFQKRYFGLWRLSHEKRERARDDVS